MQNPEGFAATSSHNRTIARLSIQKWLPRHRYYVPKMSINAASTTRIMETVSAVRRHSAIVELSGAFSGDNDCDNIATMSSQWASMERQWLLALYLGKWKGGAATLTHDRTIGHLSSQQCFRWHCHYALRMSVNGEATIFSLPLWKIKGLYDYIDP